MLAAGGQESDQIRDYLPPDGVVDVALLFPALDQPGSPQQVEVVGESGPRNLQGLLDFSRRHLASRPNQEEEDPEPRQVGQRLERLRMDLAGVEPGERERPDPFHTSINIKLSNGVK